jgi:hypothetical protein
VGRREDEASRMLEDLRTWALLDTDRLWALMDPENIRESWVPLSAPFVQLHTTLVTLALEVTDGYCAAKAADARVPYDGNWRLDHPGRVLLVRDRPAVERINLAPVLVLWRLKLGDESEAAMRWGRTHLRQIAASEAHSVFRGVTFARAQA